MSKIEDGDLRIAEKRKKVMELEKAILTQKDKEEEQLDARIVELESQLIKPKTTKHKIKLPSIHVSSRSRKIVASVVVICLVAMSFSFVFINQVVAASPIVVTASPGDGTFFASTNNGSGVNWNANVSDADNDIAEVELWSNSSGNWVLFYDSGALGGVAYHDASGTNSNWTGSWTKYWWNISANDGSWTNVTYSFTTGYQWGDPQMAMLDDDKTYYASVVYKNNTGDYYLFAHNATNSDINMKTSDTGANWSLEQSQQTFAASQGPACIFTYNNQPSILYARSAAPTYYTFAYYDGDTWTTQVIDIGDIPSSYGGDVIYYDGQWQMVVNRWLSPNGMYLDHWYGTPYTTWTYRVSLDYTNVHNYFPSLAILDGIMYCVYKDAEDDLHWETYNGVAWTDRGDIIAMNSEDNLGCSMVKDPVNQQLVSVYVDSSGDLRYRVTDNLTGWSKNDLIFSKGDYTIQYPYVDYIDHRLVISFSYNLRGNYNIYTINAPDYSGRSSGLNYTLNRIQWPDANPDDTYVNSTIFNLRNINNRSIKTITWHFEDIGEITCASNIEVWTNMSGAWTSIGTCDASGDVSTLDISGLIPGSGEWIRGNYTYWKVEILAVGAVSEDLHSTDEDIYYKITF